MKDSATPPIISSARQRRHNNARSRLPLTAARLPSKTQ
ncbi:hypothetical protein CHUV0807_2505 [Cardiobacterium hominis]|uniref:Uncharacterized protein n=1 Tax=Cardiobacterium hominis TaxID=2718 RepID=A0A1C3H7B6_9GAMM|nr:hypothetical protein CHUV0807_2505 [Cardiobacterium hominis]